MHNYIHAYTVYVQIFEACKFRGCHKSGIFTILFLRITKYPALWFMQVKVCHWNFEDENFVDGHFAMRTSKITSLENLDVYVQYSLVQARVQYIFIRSSYVRMCINSIEFRYSNFNTLYYQVCFVAVIVLWQSTESIIIIFVAFKDSFMAYQWQSIVIHNLNKNFLNLLAMCLCIYHVIVWHNSLYIHAHIHACLHVYVSTIWTKISLLLFSSDCGHLTKYNIC